MKRLLAYAIVLIYITLCTTTVVASADYAMAEFAGVTPTLTNMGEVQAGRDMDRLLTEENIDGVPCVRMHTRDLDGSAVNGSWLIFDVSSSYMARLKDGTGVDITIEYYDAGDGTFCLTYDARDDRNKPSEKVLLNGTNTWKTYTFHLYDAYFGNRHRSKDFSLCLYDTSIDFSTSDLIFKSIKAEKSGKIFPINLTENIANTGNLYEKGATPVISLAAENILSEEVSADYICTITDSEGNIVKTVNDTVILEPGTNSLEINTGITLCNTYDVKIVFSGKNNLYGEFKTNFAISVVSDTNIDYAANTHYRISARTPSASIPFAVKSGASMIRDGMPWEDCVDANGEFSLKPHHTAYVDEAIENGLELCILMGSQQESNFPQSDTEIKAYGDYVYNLVKALKGKVEVFEVWNEFHHTAYKLGMTNNDTRANPPDSVAQAYVKVLKEAYTRAKEANPECKIIGLGGLPAVWDNWIKAVLKAGAGGYMDIMSLHEYDEYGGPERKMMTWLNNVKNHIITYGCEDIPIWVTEAGWSTSWDISKDEETKYSYGIRQYVMYKEFGIEKYFWYDLKSDGVNSRDYQDNFGTIWYHNDREHIPYSARPSYVAFANMNDKLGNSEITSHITDGNGSEIYCFTNQNGDNTYVLWNASDTVSADVTLDTSQEWRLYDVFGNDSKLDISADGMCSVSVSGEPVYITAPEGLAVDLIQDGEVADDFSQLVKDRPITVEAVYDNRGGLDSAYVLVCARYKNGVLIDMTTENGQLDSSDAFENISAAMTGDVGDYDEIKVYMWKDYTKLIPLAYAREWSE